MLSLRALPWLLAAVVSSSALAARVEFTVQPALIELGETTTVSLSLFGAGRSQAPALQVPEGLRIVGQSQNMQFGTEGSSVSYQYTVAPLRAGEFTIGPFVYRVGDQSFDLPALKLEVKPAGQNPRREQDGVRLAEVLFLELAADKSDLLVQEPCELTLSLFSHPRLNLADDFELQNMEVPGIKFGPWMRLQTTRETRNGQIWNVRKFRAQARPLRSGSFALQPGLGVKVVVPRQDPFGGMFEFGAFGSLFQEARPVSVSAEQPTALTVREPPTEGRPADYAGAVGSFQFLADLSHTQVTAGDPVTLRIAISGRGNLDVVAAPEPALDARWKTYDTRTVAQELNDAGTAGKKVFEKVIIPLDPSVDRIPELVFSYFDPDLRAYRTARAGPFPLAVQPGAASSGAAQVVSGLAAGQRQVLGEDIVYWKSPGPEWIQVGADGRSASRAPHLAWQGVPALGLLLAWTWRQRRQRLSSDRSYARRVAAPRQARAGLRAARTAAESGNAEAVVASLAQALTAYFADRLDVGPGEVSADLLRRRFAAVPAATPLLDRTIAWLDQAEAARYGGLGLPGTPPEWIAEAESLLRELERVKGGRP
jgi:hypothetical protein